MKSAKSMISRDLDESLSKYPWLDLDGVQILVTGGTGFVGCWLIESFLWLTEMRSSRALLTVVSRDPGKFQKRHPRLFEKASDSKKIQFRAGDVQKTLDCQGRFTHLIHAATPVVGDEEDYLSIFKTLTRGTENVLEFASKKEIKRVLLTSSGAVYGKQPSDHDRLCEDDFYGFDPYDDRAFYAEGKRMAEMLACLHAKKGEMEMVIARCFAFSGSYLPLDAQFAVGNFVRDALHEDEIIVRGDGSPYRSYLDGADLSAWLWGLLLRGKSGDAYNVGSEDALSIAELASLVANSESEIRGGKPKPVRILKQAEPGKKADRYIPSTEKIRNELGLRQMISFTRSIKGMLQAASLKKG